MTVPRKLHHHIQNIILNILKYPSICIVLLMDTLPGIGIVRKISLHQDSITGTGQTLTSTTLGG